MSLTRRRLTRATLATLFVPLFVPLMLGATLPQPASAAQRSQLTRIPAESNKPNRAFDAWADRFAED